jgi:small subunit ribosomal protein S4
MSEYGVRLREKQKLRYFYGISENTMRRSYQRASEKKGITGYNLLLIFESRLDNVLYRTNVCRSRKEARQMVRHGHVKVNGRKVDIPSFEIRVGDVVALSDKKRDFFVGNLQALKDAQIPATYQFDEKALTVKFLHAPKREDIDVPVQEQLIVEYYSR